MPFDRNIRNPRLIAEYLTVDFRSSDGRVSQAAINLNSVLGHSDGKFEWGGRNFTASAREISLSGSELSAELPYRDGWIEAEVDLSQHIRLNKAGKLETFDIVTDPVIGPSSDTATNTLSTKSFDQTIRNPRLIAEYLVVSYKGSDGRMSQAGINLDSVLGHSDGKFEWGGRNFSASARGISLSGSELRAELPYKGGWVEAEVDLSQHIRLNKAGKLETFGIVTDPVIGPSFSDTETITTLSTKSFDQFDQAIRNPRLIEEYLTVDFQGSDGKVAQASINLDSILGHSDGKFKWGGKDFSTSARGIRLSGFELSAKLPYRDSWTEAKTDLSQHIRLSNGRLETFDIEIDSFSDTGTDTSSPKSFGQVIRNPRLIEEYFTVDFQGSDGKVAQASINLDSILGHSDGQFKWGSHNFSMAAREISLHGSELSAQLPYEGGWSEAKVNLSEHIQLRNGELETFGIKTDASSTMSIPIKDPGPLYSKSPVSDAKLPSTSIGTPSKSGDFLPASSETTISRNDVRDPSPEILPLKDGGEKGISYQMVSFLPSAATNFLSSNPAWLVRAASLNCTLCTEPLPVHGKLFAAFRINVKTEYQEAVESLAKDLTEASKLKTLMVIGGNDDYYMDEGEDEYGGNGKSKGKSRGKDMDMDEHNYGIYSTPSELSTGWYENEDGVLYMITEGEYGKGASASDGSGGKEAAHSKGIGADGSGGADSGEDHRGGGRGGRGRSDGGGHGGGSGRGGGSSGDNDLWRTMRSTTTWSYKKVSPAFSVTVSLSFPRNDSDQEQYNGDLSLHITNGPHWKLLKGWVIVVVGKAYLITSTASNPSQRLHQEGWNVGASAGATIPGGLSTTANAGYAVNQTYSNADSFSTTILPTKHLSTATGYSLKPNDPRKGVVAGDLTIKLNIVPHLDPSSLKPIKPINLDIKVHFRGRAKSGYADVKEFGLFTQYLSVNDIYTYKPQLRTFVTTAVDDVRQDESVRVEPLAGTISPLSTVLGTDGAPLSISTLNAPPSSRGSPSSTPPNSVAHGLGIISQGKRTKWFNRMRAGLFKKKINRLKLLKGMVLFEFTDEGVVRREYHPDESNIPESAL